MEDLNKVRVSVSVHAVLGFAMGYLTVSMYTGAIGGVLGIVALFVAGFGLERGLGKKGVKWWIANGVFIYLFTWLVGLIYFFNLGF